MTALKDLKTSRRRYPVEDLVHILGLDRNELAERIASKIKAERHAIIDNLGKHEITETIADRYVGALGLHVSNIWPDLYWAGTEMEIKYQETAA